MAFRFRPELNALEGRDVPASFSFQLPDGSIGSGQFNTPEGLDPLQVQTFSVGNISVIKDGLEYAVQPGATAIYQYGTLVAVNAVAIGPDTIQLSNGIAIEGGYVVPLALDGTAAQEAFQFADGTVGTLSYDIPWDQVDDTQQTQSLIPTRFNLNIAGQNFDIGSAAHSFTPYLVFASGEFRGVAFSVTGWPGFAYSSVAGTFDVDGTYINTATNAANGWQYVTAPLPQQYVTLDFSTAETGKDYKIKLTFMTGNADDLAKVEVNILAGDSAAQIADKVAQAIGTSGKYAATRSGTVLKIKPSTTKLFDNLNYSTFDMVNGKEVWRPLFKGPQLTDRQITTVSGGQINTTPGPVSNP